MPSMVCVYQQFWKWNRQLRYTCLWQLEIYEHLHTCMSFLYVVQNLPRLLGMKPTSSLTNRTSKDAFSSKEEGVTQVFNIAQHSLQENDSHYTSHSIIFQKQQYPYQHQYPATTTTTTITTSTITTTTITTIKPRPSPEPPSPQLPRLYTKRCTKSKTTLS